MDYCCFKGYSSLNKNISKVLLFFASSNKILRHSELTNWGFLRYALFNIDVLHGWKFFWVFSLVFKPQCAGKLTNLGGPVVAESTPLVGIGLTDLPTPPAPQVPESLNLIVPIYHFQINSAGALVKEVSNYNFTGYEHMISKIKNKDATKPLKRFDTMRCAF